MTLLLFAAALPLGLLIAWLLRKLCEALASAGTDDWAYYVSGVAFALSLALPPVWLVLVAGRPSDPILGLRAERFFGVAFPALTLLLGLYLVMARRLGIHRYNPVVMSLIAGAPGAVAFALAALSARRDGALAFIVLIGSLMVLLPSTVALGKAHAGFEPDPGP